MIYENRNRINLVNLKIMRVYLDSCTLAPE